MGIYYSKWIDSYLGSCSWPSKSGGPKRIVGLPGADIQPWVSDVRPLLPGIHLAPNST